jgi:hypothetical protein
MKKMSTKFRSLQMKKMSKLDIQEEHTHWKKKLRIFWSSQMRQEMGPLSSPLSADVSENYQLFPH